MRTVAAMADENCDVIGGEVELHQANLLLSGDADRADAPTTAGVRHQAMAGEDTSAAERKKKEEEKLRIANEQKAKCEKNIEFGGVAAVVSLTVMMAGFFLVSSEHTLVFKILIFLVFVLFSSAFSLMLLNMQLLGAEEIHVSGCHRAISNCLFYACNVLLLPTIICLLVVLPYRPDIYVAVGILVLAAATVGLVYCYVSRKSEQVMDNEMAIAAAGAAPDADARKEMESSYKITSAIASMSFAGLVGVFFGVYKGDIGGGDISVSSVHVAVMFMFTPAVLSMLLMILWMKVPESKNPKLREFVLKTIRYANAGLLLLLAIAAFAASFGILGFCMLAALVPLLLAAIVQIIIQHCTRHGHVVGEVRHDEMWLKFMADMAIKVTALPLGGIMAIFAGFLGDNGNTKDKMTPGSSVRTEHKITVAKSPADLKTCMYLLASAFASGLGLMYMTMWPGGSARGSSKQAINILAASVVMLLSAAALAIYSVEVMKS